MEKRQILASVSGCEVIELGQHHNRAGNISIIENNTNLPFEVKRVFYIYDIPGGESRGAHSHRECHQFIVAVSGSFEIEMDDGVQKRTVALNRPYFGLHIPPGIWAAEKDFSSGAICLVMTSRKYDEKDYIRNYQDFLTFRNENENEK
jgi:hypothetical protein